MALYLSTSHFPKTGSSKSLHSSYSCSVFRFNGRPKSSSLSLCNRNGKFGSVRSESDWTRKRRHTLRAASTGGNGGSGIGNDGGGGGGGDGEGEENEKNRTEAMMALAALGKSLESIPPDLAMAVKAGRVPAAIINRYVELEKSSFFRWLMQFGGFKERLLADDLFLAKVAMECGVGIFTKVKF